MSTTNKDTLLRLSTANSDEKPKGTNDLFDDKFIKLNKGLFKDYLDYIEDEREFSADTTRSYRYVLGVYRQYLGNTDIQELNISEVNRYFVKRKRGEIGNKPLKVGSVNTERCILRSFFWYLSGYRSIRLNFDYTLIKCAKVDDPETNFVTPEQLNAAIAKLDNKQDRLILITFFATAMRIGELVKLSVDNIRENELYIKGKGGKRRTIPISPELSEAIQDHIYEQGISTGVIFRHQSPKSTLPNQAYTVNGLRKRLYRKLEPYGIRIRPHWYRHGGATELHANGMDIRALQTYLGHKRIETTQRYTHITDNHLREAVRKANHLQKINIKSALT